MENNIEYFIEINTQQNGDKFYRAKFNRYNYPREGYNYIDTNGDTLSHGKRDFASEEVAIEAIEKHKAKMKRKWNLRVVKQEDKKYSNI
jgi:hypothetical protein